MCPWNVSFAEETEEPGYAARGPGESPVGVEVLPGEEGSPRERRSAAGDARRERGEAGDRARGAAGAITVSGCGISAGGGKAADGMRRASPKTRGDVPAETSGRANAHPGTEAPSLVELMRMTREEWDTFSRGSAIRRAGYAGFKRNVAVAMGNWLDDLQEPPAEAMAVLRDALEDESELVRKHAAWALARVSGSP